MVKLCTFLPEADDFACLKDLHGPLRIIQPSNLIGGTSKLLLVGDDNFSVQLFADYTDVIFKFECFGLRAKSSSSTLWLDVNELIVIDHWQQIKCLFRFEWERPALQGEIPVSWEQIVRQRGKKSEISDRATAICISMVGLVFWDCNDDSSTTAIITSDDEPGTVRIYRSLEEILTFASECEDVTLEDVPQWLSQQV